MKKLKYIITTAIDNNTNINIPDYYPKTLYDSKMELICGYDNIYEKIYHNRKTTYHAGFNSTSNVIKQFNGNIIHCKHELDDIRIHRYNNDYNKNRAVKERNCEIINIFKGIYKFRNKFYILLDYDYEFCINNKYIKKFYKKTDMLSLFKYSNMPIRANYVRRKERLLFHRYDNYKKFYYEKQVSKLNYNLRKTLKNIDYRRFKNNLATLDVIL